MNTQEISTLLQRNDITKRYFQNVYALDQLQRKRKINKQRWFLICNCCPKNLPGLHWLVMFREGNTIDFFYSFGGAPSEYGMERFIQRQKAKHCYYNGRQIQDIFSSACGAYCIFYAFLRCCGVSTNNILSIFSPTNYVYNDNVVLDFVNKTFLLKKYIFSLSYKYSRI